MIANWLHGVARTTALRAKVATARRRAKEIEVTDLHEPASAPLDIWSDLRPLLDHEIARLPDKYRIPIVLCGLENKSIKEAACGMACRAV
jgi:DNA-directed RNA polymerase specialized sigma24 family protein